MAQKIAGLLRLQPPSLVGFELGFTKPSITADDFAAAEAPLTVEAEFLSSDLPAAFEDKPLGSPIHGSPEHDFQSSGNRAQESHADSSEIKLTPQTRMAIREDSWLDEFDSMDKIVEVSDIPLSKLIGVVVNCDTVVDFRPSPDVVDNMTQPGRLTTVHFQTCLFSNLDLALGLDADDQDLAHHAVAT